MKKRQSVLWIILLLLATSVGAAEKRDLLIKGFSADVLAKHLAKAQEWVAFPTYQDRAFWDKQPANLRAASIQKGEVALNFSWDIIKATDYLAINRTGNREQMQKPDNARKEALKNLLLAELMEGKGRFIDQIINGVWAICEQSNWVLSAHLALQKQYTDLPDIDNMVIDLGSGETGALLAWTHYFLKERLDEASPLIAKRIATEIRRNILDPYYKRNDLWWMGLGGESSNNRRGLVNNWNPWINFNVLQCILLMESDQEKRTTYTYKTMHSVDQFINSYHDDGACDEGPSYWSHAGGKFFEYLELLHQATGGDVNIYSHPLVKNIGTYIYQVYIDDPYFVNFADASAKGGVNAGLVYRYGVAINDATMQGFGAFYEQKEAKDNAALSGSMYAILQDLQWTPRILQAPTIEPLVGDYWFPQTQVAGGREKASSKEGFYFAAKGGHNDEFHNHNDVGSFILYYNGLPLLVDAGVGTYTKQTFSKDRYKIWTMQSAFHNLPVINGYEQPAGLTYEATNTQFTAKGDLHFTTDIAKAYPADAAINTWRRSYTLQRKKHRFIISDEFNLSSFKKENELHLLAAHKPEIIKPGVIKLSLGETSVEMHYQADLFGEPQIVPITIEDPRLLNSWPEGLYQLIFTATKKDLQGKYTLEVVESNEK